MANRNVPGTRRIRRGEANPRAAHKAGTRRSSGRRGSDAAMSTARGDSRTHFTIAIEHSGWDSGIAEAIRILDGNISSIQKSFKYFESNRMSNVPSGSNSDFWMSTTQKSNSGGRYDKFTMGSLLSLQKFPREAANELLRDIGTIGVSEIKGGIRNPENAPLSPRYDTGLMYNSVDYKLRKSEHETRVEIGWTRRFHKYFDFQERGTGQFIGPLNKGGSRTGAMNAIKGGYRRTVPKAYSLMKRYLSNYSYGSGFSGRYDK